jgi:hypothetical protein
VAAVIVRGQTSDVIDRSQLFRTRPGVSPPEGADESGTSQGYAASTPNDEDLGIQAILKRQEKYKPFSVSISAPFYFTSNVALSSNNEKSDVLFTPGLSVVYQPHLTQTLYAEAGVAQQFFLYDQYDSLNFASFDASLGLSYYLPQFHDLSLGLHYDYNRLTNEDWDKLFSNHQLLFTAELPFRLGRAIGLSTGVGINISLAADPESPRRNEYDFHLGYHVQFSRSFSIDAVIRAVLKEFEGDRTDVSEILSLTANYRVRDWLILSGVGTLAWNQSSQSEFDYEVANLGGAVALIVRF